MSDRRRVLFVVPRFHNNLYVGTKALVEAGHAVGVFALKVTPSETHDYLAPQKLGHDMAEVRQAFDAFDPDLVLIRRAKPLSHQVFRLCRERGVAMAQYSQHPADERPILIRRLADRLRGWPDTRVTPTPPHAGREVAPGVVLLPLPVSRAGPAGAPPPRGADGRLRLLCVAKLEEKRKNIPWLVNAIRTAGLQHRVRLTLVGSRGGRGGRQQLEWLRAEAGGGGWLTLLEDMPYAKMPEVYRAHDACILPSFAEPFAIAPLEAACYGTVPIITTESGSAGYVEHGVSGLLLDPRDAGRLAAILAGLADDPALLRRLSDATRAMAEDVLSPKRFVQGIENLARSVAA